MEPARPHVLETISSEVLVPVVFICPRIPFYLLARTMPRPQCSLLPQAVPWAVPSPGAGPWHPPNHCVQPLHVHSQQGCRTPTRAQVMADGDTLPWDTCGVGRRGWAPGRMQAAGDAPSPPQRELGSPRCVRFIPAPGSPRHQSRASVTDTEARQEFPPSPTGGNALGPHPAPLPDLPGEGLPARGWDGSSRLSGSGSRLSPLQPLISHRSRAGPPALPRRGCSHRLPTHPGSPSNTGPRDTRDGERFLQEFQTLLHPIRVPGSVVGGWVAMERTAEPGWERVWGRKGLTRGSLLTLSNDLNQTERFCHPSR